MNRFPLSFRLLSIFLFQVSIGNAQNPFATSHELQMSYANQPTGLDFGNSISVIGDINGDGLPEMLVGAPHANANGTLSGAAYVFSTAPAHTGTLLRTIAGTGSYFYSGITVVGGKDINGDNVPDYAVGSPFAPDYGYNFTGGRVEVFSGTTGALLYQFDGGGNLWQFGTRIAFGDVNGDGGNDIIISSPNALNASGIQAGRVDVYSGRNGGHIRTYEADSSFVKFGTALDVGDVNGDSFADIVVGSSLGGNGGSGRVSAYSGQTGALLYSVTGQTIPGNEYIGNHIAFIGDIDGDGTPDIGSGSHYLAHNIMVISGASGNIIMRCNLGSSSVYPESMAAGDYNHDGYADLAISNYNRFAVVSGGASGSAGLANILYEHIEPTGGITSFTNASFLLRGQRAFAFANYMFNNRQGRVSVVPRRFMPTTVAGSTGMSCQSY